MIKLIASDLDGTLLQNNAQSLNPRIIDIIKQLHNQGILFVAASGRQYPNLYRLFEPVSKHMAFICENGSLIRYQGATLKKSTFPRNLGLSLIEDINSRAGCEVLISGTDTSYLKPKSPDFLIRMRDIVKNNVTPISDFTEIDEDFIKISVYEKTGIADGHGPSLIETWQNNFKCTISGHGWLDFTAPTVNKGTAIETLLEKFNISPEEVMAFGDNYNDLEMLSLAKYSYVMENAAEDIKNRYPYRSKQVEDTLEEWITTKF